ncbi:fasciclin domain-containing protein [Rubrolithibacter danxiaensis]|uniref:fasciclin domain-containing protein n=1 Tax=Rubrolithibacter danxiaensis TaxID=3390805 RepID=UPI003BF7AFB1
MTKKSIFVIAAALSAGISVNALGQTQPSGNSGSSSSAGAATGSGTATGNVATTSATAEKLTFSTLLSTSGLDKKLQGEYTFFAPSNEALSTLSVDTTEAGKAKLTSLLNNHIVQGKYTSKDLAKAIAAGKGSASMATLGGEKLTFRINENKNLEVSDTNGNTAVATSFDQTNTNGITHVIDKPLAPKQ